MYERGKPNHSSQAGEQGTGLAEVEGMVRRRSGHSSLRMGKPFTRRRTTVVVEKLGAQCSPPGGPENVWTTYAKRK